MKKKIYKYKLQITDYQEIEVPIGYQILSLDVQDNMPHIWILIDPLQEEKMKLKFSFYATGQDIDCGNMKYIDYIGTVHLCNGSLVYHCFFNGGLQST